MTNGGETSSSLAPIVSLPSRINSKNLARNQPSSNGAGGSAMDDLLGGLAQLLGGNLKLPPNQPPVNNIPMASFSTSGSEQSKLANLLSQLTGGGSNNLGLNQRIPPHLNHLIPRGPNGSPLFPSFIPQNNAPANSPPKITINPRPGPPPGGNFGSMPPISMGANSNYPSFQIPFIPLLPSGSNQPRPVIPLNSNNNNNNNNPISKPPLTMPGPVNFPPLHGLTKAEMDALFHQFVNGIYK